MAFDRREFLLGCFAASVAACRGEFSKQTGSVSFQSAATVGIPGPYPGRVAVVHHPGALVSGRYQRDPVRRMVDGGMQDLTGADSPAEAWRTFFQPGDVVGIKVNPVGAPHVISAPEVLHSIIAGLEQAGVTRNDIVVYDRYGKSFVEAGFVEWLPEGVRWMAASPEYRKIQLDMEGYEPDVYLDLPLVHPDYRSDFNLDDPHVRRSYVARLLTREVNKLINLCVLKHHQSAGVTLALKNLSHGLVNNVNRSHVSRTANACGVFIPAVVNLPIIREKTVLHILDGIKGAYHGGPGRKVEKYCWEHQTLYFATDPVALDRIGWEEIDKRRKAAGLEPVATAPPDEDSTWLHGQVEHIELAGNLGLGIFDPDAIRLTRTELEL